MFNLTISCEPPITNKMVKDENVVEEMKISNNTKTTFVTATFEHSLLTPLINNQLS